ncbi:MAG: hydroxymethylbilane synthase [Lachnospiraceae bacterium]|nr:hydroxymethylbilane synthase [Lachnospiraceae bacterium]
MKIRIGTRGSKLALIQTEYVKNRLEKKFPEHEYEIVVIKTKGDRIQDKPLNQIGDKGLFVAEIEKKILEDEIQLGVHSMKDMPSAPAKGLIFSKLWGREDPRDVLILRENTSLDELPEHAVIGTGSERRARQLKRLRKDLEIRDIRGNVDTRLKKMEEQKLDGIVLAAAGLKRLGMQDRITSYLEPQEMICAPAQGILALELRQDQTQLLAMLDVLADSDTDLTGRAEREFLKDIGGDCHDAIGAFCCLEGARLHLRAVFGKKDRDDLYYADVIGTDPVSVAKEAARKIREQISGTVYLVGGGPGDPDLITVKGKRLLEEADCIIYDRLSSPELLGYALESCEKIYVGKENHHHTMKQEEINRLLVDKSLEYEKVVRLKGGDPYVFGRGGEEALALMEHGVHFEIVPGISSALAGPAYAGIPVTHRGLSSGFHVVTAHNRRDELADIDFEAMAEGKDTCVFLMGLGKLKEITGKLLEAGMRKDMGAAVISCASTPNQKTVVSNLADIAKEVEMASLVSPALIVVGEVVNLRNQLMFFENRPLFGQKILVPKIGKEPSRLSLLLKEKGAAVHEIQTGEIRWIANQLSIQKLQKINWIIFTSKKGVEGFFRNLSDCGMDVRAIAKSKIAVIGSETGRTLKKYGLIPDLMPKQFHSEEFADVLRKRFEKEKGEIVVCHPTCENAGRSLKKQLGGICHLEELFVYENEPVEIQQEELVKCTGDTAVLFTCASNADRVLHAWDGKIPEHMKIVSIGKKCTERLRELGVAQVWQSEQATYESMVKKIMEF